ncbi:hypothetical protein ACE1N8_04120 [Streptomyces sp. DSM 116494]|uniref:hypothetical protein n=1 Tax=Streptomyces okerensis TaxID=3344655 RepID=UPI00388D0C9D
MSEDPGPGDGFAVSADGRRRTVARPPDTAPATAHAAPAGVGAALVAGGPAEGHRRPAVRPRGSPPVAPARTWCGTERARTGAIG